MGEELQYCVSGLKAGAQSSQRSAKSLTESNLTGWKGIGESIILVEMSFTESDSSSNGE